MEASKLKSALKEIVSTSIYILAAVIIVFILTEFVVQKTVVVGASMENTVHDGDHILVNKLIYDFSEPKRFDVIVFPYHLDKSMFFIKRVIGLPNETVRIDEDGIIYIDGEQLQENYGKEVILDAGVAAETITLGDDEYFVLGDNRNNSSDSRDSRVGFITAEEIIGNASLRIWPIEDFGIVRH